MAHFKNIALNIYFIFLKFDILLVISDLVWEIAFKIGGFTKENCDS